MKLLTLLALFTVAVGIYTSRKSVNNEVKEKEDVLSKEVVEQDSSQTEIDSISKSKALSTPTPTNSQSSSVQKNQSNLSDMENFIYPGATVLSSSKEEMKIVTEIDIDKITQWYKDKIREEGLNTKTFVTTSTNGNVHNELVGAGKEGEVRVIISKDSDSNSVVINIKISR